MVPLRQVAARAEASAAAGTDGDPRMLKEFQEFVARGNVMDLAVGVIIGAAFGKIVDSLVNDIMMPIIGLIFRGGINFADHFVPLSASVTATSLAEARRQGNVF